MKSTPFEVVPGKFGVHIANGRTKTAAEWAAEVADLIMFVSAQAPPGIREQAYEFKDKIRRVVEANVAEAIRHERIACAGLAERAGHAETALAIRTRR